MRSSLVVRASNCQCTSCNGPGFDPSIRRHSGIWGAADEAVLNIVRTKKKKIPPPQKKKRNHLNEEITPLLPTRIGERFSPNISNLGHAALMSRCELPPINESAELTRGALQLIQHSEGCSCYEKNVPPLPLPPFCRAGTNYSPPAAVKEAAVIGSRKVGSGAGAGRGAGEGHTDCSSRDSDRNRPRTCTK
jgi:hypothetical protein